MSDASKYPAGALKAKKGLGPRSVTIDVVPTSAASHPSSTATPTAGTGSAAIGFPPSATGSQVKLSRRPISFAAFSNQQYHPRSLAAALSPSSSGAHGYDVEAGRSAGGAGGLNFGPARQNIRTDHLEGRSYRFAPAPLPLPSASSAAGGSEIALPGAGQRNKGRASASASGAASMSDFSDAHSRLGASYAATNMGGPAYSEEGGSASGFSGAAFSPRSYTADDAIIRDRTAQLADMALGGGGGGSTDAGEESGFSSYNGGPAHSGSGWVQRTGAAVAITAGAGSNASEAAGAGSLGAGPSNLALTLQSHDIVSGRDTVSKASRPDTVKDSNSHSQEQGSTSNSAGNAAPPHTASAAQSLAVQPQEPFSPSPGALTSARSPNNRSSEAGVPMTWTLTYGTLGTTDEETEEDLQSDGEADGGEVGGLSATGLAPGTAPRLAGGLRRPSYQHPYQLHQSSTSAHSAAAATAAYRRLSTTVAQSLGYGVLALAQDEAQEGGSGGAYQKPSSISASSAGLPASNAVDERAPLLSATGGDHAGYGSHAAHHAESSLTSSYRKAKHFAAVLPMRRTISGFAARTRKITWREVASASAEPVRLLPAVILGLLLNVLDGVSYGMITFPTSYPIFADFGGDGVSMFFVTCILSQLVFSLGGSIFGGGNGSMMIEVVPFYHLLVKTIFAEVGDDNPEAVISTTVVAYALSSIFIGLAFLLLGWLRLGKLIEFFPRHILVGCIGGVGVFLIETGLEVSGRLQAEDGFQWNIKTLRYFLQSWHMVALWLLPFTFAVLLRFITHQFHHPLIFPTYFMFIPIVFYIITAGILRIDLAKLRADGWVFDIGRAAEAPFYRFYTYIDFRQTSFKALVATIPTQLALTFFGILHVPLNVPALGISVGEDNVDTDRELIGHGISNLAAGVFFSGPNYITYVNSLLFYRVGGGSRLSGLMLAAGTIVILMAGPASIGYLPVMIVGALIFVLGIDLVKEALWDTIGRVNHWEYFTICIIIIVMTLWDFVVGILAGIILACLFFVVQNSRRKTVRAIFDGSIARSTVRRHPTQRRFLDVVGTQTQILKLQGFLFFGTINGVEQLIRRALDISAWHQHPMRFLIVDFSLVSGVDFSAAEAFTRIQRLLDAKGVVLIFCGVTPESDIGIALRSVGMWADQGVRLEVFAHLNSALEWTENEYIRGMYTSSLAIGKTLGHAYLATAGALSMPGQQREPAFVLDEQFENSPRQQHIHEAARTAMNHLPSIDMVSLPPESVPHLAAEAQVQPAQKSGAQRDPTKQPLLLLLATFREYAEPELDATYFAHLVGYFERVPLPQGQTLWQAGDEPDGLYVIESGILKAKYDFVQENFDLSESMLAGTIAGELTFLSKQKRNTVVHAETECVLWRLDGESLSRLEKEQPDVFSTFFKILLRVTGDEQHSLMSYLVSRLT